MCLQDLKVLTLAIPDFVAIQKDIFELQNKKKNKNKKKQTRKQICFLQNAHSICILDAFICYAPPPHHRYNKIREKAIHKAGFYTYSILMWIPSPRGTLHPMG